MKKTLKRITTGFLSLILAAVAITPLHADALSYSGSSSYQSSPYYSALTRVRLTGDQRKDIVAIALTQVGYQEGNTNRQLDGTTNGSGNYTEYGKWYGLQDMWCAMFVSWCASQAGVSTSVVPKHSYTPSGLNTYISWGRAYSRQTVANGGYTPKPGDIVYFKTARNSNLCNHVGIVTDYSNRILYTVEGNSSNAVQTKSYSITNSTIVYICSPNYKSSGTTTTNNTASSSYFPKCGSSYSSIVDALNSIGASSSYAYRKTIAQTNSISNYSGSASQNNQMLNLLKAGLLKKP